MIEFNYKIKQLSENFIVDFSGKVKMSIEYSLEITVPEWFDVSTFCHKSDTFKNLKLREKKHNLLDGTKTYCYQFISSTIAKCDLEKDEFDEDTGVFICETRAEIKALSKIRRIFDFLCKRVNSDNKESLYNKILKRIEKNQRNLERLTDKC